MTDPGNIIIRNSRPPPGRPPRRRLARPAVRRRPVPPAWWPGDTFTACDLADPAATARAADRLAAGPPVTGLLCAAGLDSRAGLQDLDVAFTACMQVNCLAHLQLLRAALAARPAAATAFRAVVISSDVIGQRMPGTAAYAAAKAAAEEAFTHASCDVQEPGIAVLIVRLPYIGVPMRAAAPGPPPPPRTPGQRPLLALAEVADAVTEFLAAVQQPRVEVRHA
jgi:NAD(P)-dependent dehydrogenase (short-subunit alcohol dehydrogenase family)